MDALDLQDLNLATQCAEGFEFEYINPAGKPTGFFITVIGSEAEPVTEWVRKTLNSQRTQAAVAAKRGKDVERTVEDDIEFGNGAAAVRIIGWRGLKQEYSKENALTLVTINSHVREQVLKESNELANFSKGKSRS